MLALLRAGGLDDTACAGAVDLLGQHIASSALERAARLREQRAVAAVDPGGASERTLSDAYGAALATGYGALPADQYPTITAMRGRLVGGGSARDAWKLRVLIDGLLAQRG